MWNYQSMDIDSIGELLLKIYFREDNSMWIWFAFVCHKELIAFIFMNSRINKINSNGHLNKLSEKFSLQNVNE